MHGKWPKLIWVFSGILGAIMIGHNWFWLDTDIFVKNDLEANLLQIRYIKQSGWTSNWNPHISLPVWQDPLLGYLNPFWAIPVLFLPIQLGVKTAYFVSLIVSGWGVYYLSRSKKIDWPLAAVLAMTFVVSGYPVARIMAGHTEKVMTLMFVPWIVYLLLSKKNPRLAGFFIAMTLWSGDVYSFVYSLIIAGILLRWQEIIWAGIFALPRLVPIWQIKDVIYKPIEPLVGTQNLFSIFYHLFWPVKQFWGSLMVWVPKNFGWWEKTGYIGILPSLVIFHLFRINKINLIIWTLMIFSMVGWRGEIFQFFHIPSRVFGYLSLLVLVAAGRKIKNILLWTGNLLIVFAMSWYAYSNRQFPKIDLSIGDIPSGSLIAFDQLNYPIHQLEAQERGIRMVATNYGFMLKGTDAELWLRFRLSGEEYTGTRPDYIIYPKYENNNR